MRGTWGTRHLLLMGICATRREYYDRLIRKEGEFDRAVQYVLNNPERAGLADWKWVWSAGVDARTTAGLETGAT